MKYRFQTKWLYDGDSIALARRFEKVFATRQFDGTVLKPRSQKLSPTRSNFEGLVSPRNQLPPFCFDWTMKRLGKPIQGNVTITPPNEHGFTSSFEFQFALSDDFSNGPFDRMNELRDMAIACMRIGPSTIGTVESQDKDASRSDKDFNTFRNIDDLAVPVSFEWITVLHSSVVERMDVDLSAAETVNGVRVGSVREFSWIALASEPFSYANEAHRKASENAASVLHLRDIHSRFKRTS